MKWADGAGERAGHGGHAIATSGTPAVLRLLTIFTVGTFSGGRRGQPEPDPGAWPDNGAGLGGNARQSNGGPGPGWEAGPGLAGAPFPQGGGFSGGPGGGAPGPYG